jgi:hypothetical protein
MENLQKKIKQRLTEVNVNVSKDDMNTIPTIKRDLDKSDTITVTDEPTDVTSVMEADGTDVVNSQGELTGDVASSTEFGKTSDIVANFFKMLDKNATLVTAANKIITPKDKIMAASEFIQRLKLDKTMLSKLRNELTKAIGESVNPKMSKKDLMELVRTKTKLKVVETIKVKDLKK